MSEVNPVHQELTVGKELSDVRAGLLKRVQMLGGSVVSLEGNTLICNFGSLLQSRLIGEFWVSKATLPKQATLQMQAAGGGGTTLVLDIKDTHKFGFKLGYVKKYEEALQELAENLLSAVR
ncbi:MAG TPA: hypothetical protein VMT91_05600 [Anaerolineales bacterium]|nr:hypothetical protein [Anaerolineales bacterium]